jgi:hypothetical protein
MTETVIEQTYTVDPTVSGEAAEMLVKPSKDENDEGIGLNPEYEDYALATEADAATEASLTPVPLDELALKEKRDAFAAASPRPTPTTSILDTEVQTPGLTTIPPTSYIGSTIDDDDSADLAAVAIGAETEEAEYTDDADGDTVDLVNESSCDPEKTPSENVEVAAAIVRKAAENIEEAAADNLEATEETILAQKELAVEQAEAELEEAKNEQAEVYGAAVPDVDETGFEIDSDDGIELISKQALRGEFATVLN